MKFLSGVFAGIATVGVLGATYAIGAGTFEEWVPGGVFVCMTMFGAGLSLFSWFSVD